ncbi:hypothetical protein BS50DRAFT_653326 [Corynespora cassiicola Philippines]|uniref:DNA mismatch repair proteins mutS family domain-containing protein n=1 Tax=Corynespora cassiicola Philippines TaxID=1448308 RepID=A0A2T2P5V7_CORCC|nr:hypothetical protein BS50DRAFT_653326 [Corynespora cassiicola Philippines]
MPSKPLSQCALHNRNAAADQSSQSVRSSRSGQRISTSNSSHRSSSRSQSVTSKRTSKSNDRRHIVNRGSGVSFQVPSDAHSGESDRPAENEDNDSLNEVIMVIDLQHRDTVGCCYYVASEEKLYFMEDVKFGGIDFIDALRIYIDPTIVLVSTKVDDAVIEKLDPDRSVSSESGQSEYQFRLPFVLEIRPTSEYSYDGAKGKLANLRLDEVDGTQTTLVNPGDVVPVEDFDGNEDAGSRQGRLLRLAGRIDLDSRLTVGCAGALLSFLQRRRAAAYLPGDPAIHLMLRISHLQMFSLRDTMFINADTLQSLQILESESHPNSHNQGPTKTTSGSKECLSVYGLFRPFARTSQGKYLLRQYFLRPSLNLEVINERLETVGTFLRPDNMAVMESLMKDLRPINNMRVLMINLRKGVSRGNSKGRGISKSVWSGLREFAYHALKIKDAFPELIGGENLTITKKVLESFEGYHLAQVGRRISDMVDFDKSAEENRTVILPGVDEELDQMKRTYNGLDALLNQVAGKLSENIPQAIELPLNVVYFPQIGFLTTVPIDPMTDSAIYHGGGLDNPWERMFSTEDQVYFKNNEMREMDDHFGDLYGIISDREIEIAHELAQFVLEYEVLLTVVSDICGEVDSLLALAQGSKEFRLSRPRLTSENIIRIKSGRHLLQELTVSSFVPNDTFLMGGSGDINNAKYGPASSLDNYAETKRLASRTIQNYGGPSTLILTGPNYSGKSIYLKQVALIVFLAHVGSFVPADSAKIGLTDKILSRVTTRESVSRSQSAFMIDLQQISLALDLATRRSLLIVDEFGKGTGSSDGAGLVCAVFEHLLGLGPERPKVVGATHFHEIFELGFLRPRPSLTFGHMEVRIDPGTPQIDDQITYLYNFCEGRSTESYGSCCAAMNGVPTNIVHRARILTELESLGEDLVVACSIMPESEAAELEEAVCMFVSPLILL